VAGTNRYDMDFNFFKKKRSSGVFVPKGEDFEEVTDKIENASLNGISEHLGYHPDQVHFYFGRHDNDFDIQQVAFEIFTDKIAFVLIKSTVSKVDKSKLKRFLDKFNLTEEFDSVRVREILESGVENKSLSIDYLSRVLGLSINEGSGGIFLVEKLGLYLYFADGYLVDIQSSDGLGKWTKYLRDLNENLFNSYVKVAEKYWGGNRKMIESEVNIQGESLASTPNAVNNEFVAKHRSEFGTINFFMLLVCHYNQKINEETFQDINHGRYTKLENAVDEVEKYKYNNFVFHFSSDGELLEIKE